MVYKVKCKNERDKIAIADKFQIISPIFQLSNKGIDVTYTLNTGTIVRALSYEALQQCDILLFLAILAFCKPHGEDGIPDVLQEKMDIKGKFKIEGSTITISWRNLAKICGYSWKGQLKEQLKKSLFRLWGVGFHTKTTSGNESAWHLLGYDTDKDDVSIAINPRLAESLRLNNPSVYNFVAFNLDVMVKLSKISFMLMFYLSTRIDSGKIGTINIETIKKNIWYELPQTQEVDRQRTKKIRDAYVELNKTGIWSIFEKNKGIITAIHKTYKTKEINNDTGI